MRGKDNNVTIKEIIINVLGQNNVASYKVVGLKPEKDIILLNIYFSCLFVCCYSDGKHRRTMCFMSLEKGFCVTTPPPVEDMQN